MKLAVISDLHVGLAARAKDLCPKPPEIPRKIRAKYDEKVDDNYIEDFVKYVLKEEITADYLLVPGDITDKAHPPQAKLASDFVLQAADALGVQREKIVFAPGNHDVDWAKFDKDDDTGENWKLRYNSIGSSDFHFRKLIEEGQGDLLSPPHFIGWEFDDLLAVAYNSASHDNPVPENSVHHGFVDPAHLDVMRRYFEGISYPNDHIRLFLVHHHPLNYSDPDPTTPDFSEMANAKDLLALLREFQFDIVVHGHKHFPHFEAYGTGSFPNLPILCSGSFSSEIDSRWVGTVENQFHLISVTGRTGPEKLITGDITNWAYNHRRGWRPSKLEPGGIHPITPFGNYLMPNQLDALIGPFAKDWLEKYDGIMWKDVVKEFPKLENLPIDSAMAAFDRLGPQLGCIRMYGDLKTMILFKENLENE